MGLDLFSILGVQPTTPVAGEAAPEGGEGFSDVLDDLLAFEDVPVDVDSAGDEPEELVVELDEDLDDDFEGALLSLDDMQLDLPLSDDEVREDLVAWAAQSTPAQRVAVPVEGDTLRTQAQQLAPPVVQAAPSAEPLTWEPLAQEITPPGLGPRVTQLHEELSAELADEAELEVAESPEPELLEELVEPPVQRARRPRRLEAVKQAATATVEAASTESAEPELQLEAPEPLPTVADLGLAHETPEGLVALPRAVRVDVDDDLAIEIATEGADVDIRLEGTVQALDEQAGLQPELDERLGRGGWNLEGYDEHARDAHDPREARADAPSSSSSSEQRDDSGAEAAGDPATTHATVSALA